VNDPAPLALTIEAIHEVLSHGVSRLYTVRAVWAAESPDDAEQVVRWIRIEQEGGGWKGLTK